MFIECTCEEWIHALTKQFSIQMPRISSYKRPRKYGSSGSGSGYVAKRPRVSLRKPKSISMATPGARVIIPLTVSLGFDMTTDPAFGYSFDTVNCYENGATKSIPGAVEMGTVFDMARIQKIEVSILPAATGLDYSAQTLSSGATNIPYVYHAVDFNDATLPTRVEMEQNPTLAVGIFNKVIRRTVYPRLEGSNGIIDVGTNEKNKFMRTGAVSSQKWNGFKMFMDLQAAVWTYGTGRITFKIFYECMQSK